MEVGDAGTLWLDGTVCPPGFLARDFIFARCFSSPVSWGQGLRTGPCVSLSPHPKTCFKLPKYCWGHGAGITPAVPGTGPLHHPLGIKRSPYGWEPLL